MINQIQHIVPASPNGVHIVYMLGYGGRIWHSKRQIALLQKQGFTILAIDFKDVLRRRNPQVLIGLMNEVDELLQAKQLISDKTFIFGVSMGGLVGFNMLKRHKELTKLYIVTGGNMALIPKYYRQKWPVNYDELARLWHDVNIYTEPGVVRDKHITMVLPKRDKVINPAEVADELAMLSHYNTVEIIRSNGGHFRTIIDETFARPGRSLTIINEMIRR